jgi:DNA-binding transcriptional ArsR family regulator
MNGMTIDEKKPLLDMETLERVAPVIRTAAHPLRLRILDYLRREGGPRSVTQIIEAAGANQAVVSQQLRLLRDQGLLSARREGSFVLYDIANPSIFHLLECIRQHGKC